MATIPITAASPKKLPSFTELVGSIPMKGDASNTLPTSSPATPLATQLTTPPTSIKEEPSVACDMLVSSSPLTNQRPALTATTSSGYFLLQGPVAFSKSGMSHPPSFPVPVTTNADLPSPRSMASTPASPTEYNNYIPVNVHHTMSMTPVPGYSVPPMLHHPPHQHQLIHQQQLMQQVQPHGAFVHNQLAPVNPQEVAYGAPPSMIPVSKNVSIVSFNTYMVSGDGSKHSMGYTSIPPLDKKLSFHVNNKDSKRRYVCKVCSRPFTTSGHLARHNRIHTGERRHQCPWPTCNAKFARQDNCMQHYKTHVNGKRKSRKRADEIEEENEISSEVELPPQSVLAT